MAAIPVLPVGTTFDPSHRSSVALVGGLVALLTGFAALIAGAVLPNPQSHPGAVLAAAAIRVAPAPVATWQDLAWVTGDSAPRSASTDPISAHHGPEPITVDDHQPPEHGDSMRLGADGQGRTEAASHWVGEIHSEIERARVTRAESPHAAAKPLDHDLRVELAAMAAVQHRRPVVK